jgi:hypothetical protein
MEQRPLRLGDTIDDYCTRERRITNHAIVAVVDNTIRQTRCTTCETEHPYRGAREPRLRKKPQSSQLYDAVLAGVTGEEQPEASAASSGEPLVETGDGPPQAEGGPEAVPAGLEAEAEEQDDQSPDAWLAHRRLIRATLPRTEGDQPTARPIPEFTMHQRPQSRPNRGFKFRGNGNGPGGQGFSHGNQAGQPSGKTGRHRRKRRSR